MTGRKLYDKYTDAQRLHVRDRYDRASGTYVRVYPPETPKAWPFLSSEDRATWNSVAKSLTTGRKVTY